MGTLGSLDMSRGLALRVEPEMDPGGGGGGGGGEEIHGGLCGC